MSPTTSPVKRFAERHSDILLVLRKPCLYPVSIQRALITEVSILPHPLYITSPGPITHQHPDNNRNTQQGGYRVEGQYSTLPRQVTYNISDQSDGPSQQKGCRYDNPVIGGPEHPPCNMGHCNSDKSYRPAKGRHNPRQQRPRRYYRHSYSHNRNSHASGILFTQKKGI